MGEDERDQRKEDYIALGAAAATPPLPEMPDGVFEILDPTHKAWAWKAYNYALDLIDIHLAHIRIATLTGDVDQMAVVACSLAAQVGQAMGMLAFMEAMAIKSMTDDPSVFAIDVVERMKKLNNDVEFYQLGMLVEALESKGWSTYWLEMQEVGGEDDDD